MTKWMLLNYEVSPYQALNTNGFEYELTLRISELWGLWKYTKKARALIPYHLNADEVYSPMLNKWVTPQQAKEIVNRRKS